MKTLRYISIIAISLIAFSSCMNKFEMPDLTTPPYGNNNIGEANTTIEELKTKFASTISSNGSNMITGNIVIEGVVVANDATGNVYKQIVINDTTGAIVIGVEDVGLYATMTIGQRIRILCDSLYIGGYGKMGQIGGLYGGSIGRMNKVIFQKHARIIGTPDATQEEMVPTVVDESFFTNTNKNKLAKFIRLENVEITEADGKATWAPEELKNSSNVVERHVQMGKTNIVMRISTYADFANSTIPAGKLNMNGVLTRFNDYWQFMLSSTEDIEIKTE